MRPTVTHVAWFALCLLVTNVGPVKVDEPIRMPLRLWIRENPRSHILGGVRISHEKGHFGGACPDLPAVNIFNLVRKGTAAMRHVATSTLAACCCCYHLTAFWRVKGDDRREEGLIRYRQFPRCSLL